MTPIEFIEQCYKEASLLYKTDEEFAKKAREMTLRLQRGDPKAMAIWRMIRAISLAEMSKIYERLDVKMRI